MYKITVKVTIKFSYTDEYNHENNVTQVQAAPFFSEFPTGNERNTLMSIAILTADIMSKASKAKWYQTIRTTEVIDATAVVSKV